MPDESQRRNPRTGEVEIYAPTLVAALLDRARTRRGQKPDRPDELAEFAAWAAPDAASPEMERYRRARADLAELQLAEKRGALYPADAWDAAMAVLAANLDRLGTDLERRCGAEVRMLLNETLSDISAETQRALGRHAGRLRAELPSTVCSARNADAADVAGMDGD